MEDLLKWNFRAGVFHATLTVAIALLESKAPYELIVTDSWVKAELPQKAMSPTCQNRTYTPDEVFKWLDCIDEVPGEVLYSAARTELFRIKITSILLTFEAITALFHFGIVINNDVYARGIKKKSNHARWFEYSVTASLMLVAVCGINQITDLWHLILAFTSSFSLNALGGLGLELNNKNTTVFIFLYGGSWFLFVSGAAMVGHAYGSVVKPFLDSDAGELWGELFGFVTILNIAILAEFLVFPAIHAANFFGVDYKKIELGYVAASLFSKTSLVVIVFASALRRPGP